MDCVENLLGVEMLRNGELDENSVNFGIAVELVDEGQEIGLRGGCRKESEAALESGFFAGKAFVFDVDSAGGIFPDEDGGEVGGDTRRLFERGDISCDFLPFIGGDLFAVNNSGGHTKTFWGIDRGFAQETTPCSLSEGPTGIGPYQSGESRFVSQRAKIA